VRNFITPALLAAAASATDPTVSFGADSVVIDIPTSLTDAQLTSFTGGSCNSSDATLVQTGGNVNIEFPITTCGLAMGDEVVFAIGANTNGDDSTALALSFFEYKVELSPEYTFTINYSYGNVAVVTSNLTDSDMAVEFKLASYDSTYTTPTNITEKLAGEQIYLGLSVDEDDVSFDHTAYNFAVTNCKIYHATDRSFEYTFFDNTRDTCSNTMIDFSITYATADKQWQLSHLLFILNNVDGAEQEIECEVKVCHAALNGSACQAAAGNCLHCTDGDECGANGACLENAEYDGFNCDCAAGFAGALCDTVV
jgi:hypothetical protein